jgi:hypothetical protein
MPEDGNLQGNLSATPKSQFWIKFNRLSAELNPICQLLALLGAHHILHVSRLNLTSKFMCRVFSMSVMVTDRCCSADFKMRRFLVSFQCYPEHGRFHGTSRRVRAFYATVKLSCSWRRQQRPSVPYYCSTSIILCVGVFESLRLPWLRFFRAFPSVVRQMPGYN